MTNPATDTAQDAPFRPFETLLDEGVALSVLRAATAGAEDGELFLERRRSEAIVLDDGRIRTASYDASEGFGLRAVKGDVAGYAHSTEISERALRRAAETARLAVGERSNINRPRSRTHGTPGRWSPNSFTRPSVRRMDKISSSTTTRYCAIRLAR